MSGIGINNENTVDLLRHLLDVQAARQKVAARNLANAGSDEYIPRRVEFTGELNRALGKVELKQTNPRHLGSLKTSRSEGQIREVIDYEAGGDETYQLERSAAELADAQLAYETVAKLMSRRLATLRTAITGKP